MSIIPICLLLVIGTFILVNRTEIFEDKPDIVDNNKEIYINNLDGFSMALIDADIKTVDEGIEYPEYSFLNNLELPSNFKEENFYAVFVLDNNKEYTILNNYVLVYGSEEKEITISFSEDYEPVRDYFIEEGDKISTINNTKLNVSKLGKTYIVKFNYDGIYFDIETNNITQSELINLLTSIIHWLLSSQGDIALSTFNLPKILLLCEIETMLFDVLLLIVV